LLIGIFIAFISPNEYTASTTMVPQNADNTLRSSGLSSIASIAGFNMNMNQTTNELSPNVYPQIIQSAPFLLEIINTPFTFSEVDHPITLFDYYAEIARPGLLATLKKYTIGLPGVISKAIKGHPEKSRPEGKNETFQLTPEQNTVCNNVAANISLNISEKDGYMELTSHFQEPLLAAQVTQKAQQLLQQYITKFKIEKATAQLQFIEERYNEKKKEFENAQATLADFRDRNKNVTSALARTEEERLQNEYQLAYEVYSQLAKQMEQAQIKVKEDTPVFSVIKPVTVPIQKSKPNRPVILVIWLFLGGVVGVFIVFGKYFYLETKNKWKEA
jgi:uncharacterized protein involved in exopolysaccharide biosynthesis